jgi:hypothetical protein
VDGLVCGRACVGTGAFARPGQGEARPHAARALAPGDDVIGAALSAGDQHPTKIGL